MRKREASCTTAPPSTAIDTPCPDVGVSNDDRHRPKQVALAPKTA
jgi:hypothetical protein